MLFFWTTEDCEEKSDNDVSLGKGSLIISIHASKTAYLITNSLYKNLTNT